MAITAHLSHTIGVLHAAFSLLLRQVSEISRPVAKRGVLPIGRTSMVFTDPLTWKCHVCGDERPDASISVHKRDSIMPGGTSITENIRYCNDRVSCTVGAEHITFLGKDGSP